MILKKYKKRYEKHFGMYCVLEIVVSSEHPFANKYTYFCIPLLHITPNRHHENEKKPHELYKE